MNFKDNYLKAAKVKRMINIQPDPECLIPNIYYYSRLEKTSSDPLFLRLLAGGSVHIEFPLSVSFLPMDCFLCIYTDRGGAYIRQNDRSVSLTEQHMTVLDCHLPFSLQSFMLPWDFKLFFFTGDAISLYRSVLFTDSLSSYEIAEHSSVSRTLCTLLSVNTTPELYDLIEMHRNLTEILSLLCLSVLPHSRSDAPDTAGYLLEMRDYLEHHYAESFSLSQWEEHFQINKYRLCREFSAAFQKPPLKYLTKIRLEESKKMLLTTDWTVHEISSKVGYDNVNHFINLFKKDTGLTPGMFRQTALGEQSAVHSHVQ
ncbi:MAG: AraC family transcriptional regulator [Lachnospiraceae bacterium]|nr:AraC family transcriptional regulator [Lachnospiraceae bacterium]